MNKIIQSLLAYVIKKIIDAKLYEYIVAAVMAQINTNLSGAEKKAAVKEQLDGLTGALKEIYKSTSTTYINLAIEAAVALAKAKLGL